MLALAACCHFGQAQSTLTDVESVVKYMLLVLQRSQIEYSDDHWVGKEKRQSAVQP